MRGPAPTTRRSRLPRRGPFKTALAAIAPLALALLSAAPVLAQTFEKVDDSTRDQLPATPFVGAAYGFSQLLPDGDYYGSVTLPSLIVATYGGGTAILAYVFFLARGLGGVKNQIADLQRRIDKATGGAAAPVERNDRGVTTTPAR